MATAIRQCSTCRIGPGGAPWANAGTNLSDYSSRCAYVRANDAEQVGRCMFGDIAPPEPCRTCQYGLGVNLMQGCTQNLNGACVNANFQNYARRP
jgi:hypothetical protein